MRQHSNTSEDTEDLVRSLWALEEARARGEPAPSIELAVLLEELHERTSSSRAKPQDEQFWEDAARVCLVGWAPAPESTHPADETGEDDGWWASLPAPGALEQELKQVQKMASRELEARYSLLLLELYIRRPDVRPSRSIVEELKTSLMKAADFARERKDYAEGALLMRPVFLDASGPAWIDALLERVHALVGDAASKSRLTTEDWSNLRRSVENELHAIHADALPWQRRRADIGPRVSVLAEAAGPRSAHGVAVREESTGDGLMIEQRLDGSLGIEVRRDGDLMSLRLSDLR